MGEKQDSRLRVSILAAGAAGMYCGSCMRDNALASALLRSGHQVTLVPLYTPLRTETKDVSIGTVYFGGVNVYLQHASRVFRHTPRVLDWLFDRPWLLTKAGEYGAQTPPSELADFTIDILKGDEGTTTKELHRLIEFLKTDVRPQVISLPNLMFIGMAKMLGQELKCPVVMELTGEDIFLDRMAAEDQATIRELIRSRVPYVNKFVATSRYYARHMAEYLGIPAEQVAVVYPGIEQDYFSPAPEVGRHREAFANGAAPTVGYLARICPQKGLHKLIDALGRLRKMPGMGKAKVVAAGYLGRGDRAWFEELKQSVAQRGLGDAFEYRGEVDHAGKLRLLDSVDVFSVPAPYAESKGLYILESLARGTPVVEPGHGAFPELVEATGGGAIVPPGDADGLAEGLAAMLRDAPRRSACAAAGHAAVKERFTDERMAEGMLGVYRSLL